MWIVSLLLALAAAYVPPVMAARGRGSRGIWIGLIFAGLFAAVASVMLGQRLVGPVDAVMFSRSGGLSFGHEMTKDLLAMIIRVSVSFCLGSLLATFLYRKPQAALPGHLGLGTGINHGKI